MSLTSKVTYTYSINLNKRVGGTLVIIKSNIQIYRTPNDKHTCNHMNSDMSK